MPVGCPRSRSGRPRSHPVLTRARVSTLVHGPDLRAETEALDPSEFSSWRRRMTWADVASLLLLIT
jgi:hypothetical protein